MQTNQNCVDRRNLNMSRMTVQCLPSFLILSSFCSLNEYTLYIVKWSFTSYILQVPDGSNTRRFSQDLFFFLCVNLASTKDNKWFCYHLALNIENKVIPNDFFNKFFIFYVVIFLPRFQFLKYPNKFGFFTASISSSLYRI